MASLTPFLMFTGRAEEAIDHYLSIFPDGRLLAIERYGPDGPGAEGSVYKATFSLAGQSFMAIDSPVEHAFGFTPALSIFVACADEAEIDRLYAALALEVLMPLDAYPFARRYAWIADRFGVSWQLSLA